MLRLSRRWIVGCFLAVVGCPAAPEDGPVDTDTAASDRLVDPLSMPAEPTVSLDDVMGAATCEGCHPDHVAEWRTSNHAYAMIDPVFRELTLLRQTDFDHTQDRFCTQCHSTLGTRGGGLPDRFTFEDLAPEVLEGVTCETCHKVADVVRDHDNGIALDLAGPMRATLAEPVSTPAHASEGSELHADPVLCGSCHDVNETSGVPMERPYEEWLASPANGDGPTCQGCHMPAYDGRAATDGPERTVHRHTFVGAGLPLEPSFVDEATFATLRGEVRAMLAQSATVTVQAPASWTAGLPFDAVTDVRNDIVGHHFPTGSTFNRQVWLEVTATDADGVVLFRTGDLDANGDLRNAWSTVDRFGDADLVTFGSGFTDQQGDPTLFTWDAWEHTSAAIPAGHHRTVTMFVPTDGARSPVTVTSRLLFRQFPPHLLRELGLERLLPRLEVFEVASASTTVSLADP